MTTRLERAPDDGGALDPETSPGEEGVVLILVIMLIALTVGSAYAFARSSVLDVIGARQRMNRVRAEMLARSGTALAVRALQEDLASSDPLAVAIESPRDTWQLIGAGPIQVPGVGELRIEIEDAARRISLNALAAGEGIETDQRSEFLERALERVVKNMPGRAEEKPYDPQEIADGILDWIDEDQQTRLGDSEEDFYGDLGAKTLPPDREIFSLGELADVPGMDGALLEAMDAYFSPGLRAPRLAQEGFNPNTAPPHVLALVYIVNAGTFLEDEEVFRILKARQDGQIFCPGQTQDENCVDFVTVINQQNDSLFPPLAFESERFVVRSRARVGETSACVATVLDRGDPEDITALAYRLDC